MKIWAHRGLSLRYPENTLLAFKEASKIKGLTGIELDIQLTKDGQIVVIHDEKIDRTSTSTGNVNEFTLKELKQIKLKGTDESIPTINEVFDLLKEEMKNGLLLNIELKNSIIPYNGMEEKIIDLVHKYGIEKNIIYSSFNEYSVRRIKEIDSNAKTGILAEKISECLEKNKICKADSLHPACSGIDLPVEKLKGYEVRGWLGGYLWPEKSTGRLLDIKALEEKGMTDVFLNEPDKYCR